MNNVSLMIKAERICSYSYKHRIYCLGSRWKFECKMKECPRFHYIANKIYQGVYNEGKLIKFSGIKKDSLQDIRDIKKIGDVENNCMHLCQYQQPFYLLPYFEFDQDMNKLPIFPKSIQKDFIPFDEKIK